MTLSDILSIAGLALAILVPFLQKVIRKVGYNVLTLELRPTYDKPLTELEYPNAYIVIEYCNSGNKALEHTDFYKPINTAFNGSFIRLAKKHYNGPDDEVAIDETIKFWNEYCSFSPKAMNPKETVRIEYWIEGFKGGISVGSKIKDGRPVYNIALRKVWISCLLQIAVSYVAILAYTFYRTNKVSLGDKWLYLLLILVPILFYWFKEIRSVRKRQCI